MAKPFGGSLKRLLSLMLGVALILGVAPGLGARVALALVPPMEKENLVYTGEPLELVTAGSSLDGYTIKYSIDGGSFTAAIPTGTDAGEYSVSWAEYNSAGTRTNGPYIIPVTIAKATPTPANPGPLSAPAGSKLGDVALPAAAGGTWSWEDPSDTSVGDEVGETKTFHAKFTPTDTNNYDTVENVSVTVNITNPVVAVTSVELDKKTASIEAGKTSKLTATVKPDDATDKTVTWTSSDEKVATVKDGTVTAVAAGKATITAKVGDKSATCEVTVTEPVLYAATSQSYTWTKGSKDGLVVTFKRSDEGDTDTTFDHFKSVSVDGKAIKETDDYTKAKGSVVVTLTPSYLNTLAAGEHTLTATFDDGTAEAKFTVADTSEPDTTKSYPAPTMSNSRGGAITSQSAEITYTISQKVPAWVSSVRTWVDLESVLQYTVDSSGVTVTCDGSDVEGAAVTIDGQRLTVTIADATALRGKTIQVAYKAKLRAGADLTPYLNSAKTTASVPYQAHTVFNGDEANAVSSKSESVKFQVGSGSGTTKTSTASTSKASTLAKTGDATSLVSAAALAATGAGAVLAGRRRRR